MSEWIAAWTILLFGLIVGQLLFQKWRREAWYTSENMPDELRKSTLLLSEKEIFTNKNVPMHGTVDQLYRLQTGFAVPVDTKKRSHGRIYERDVVQLSVYRYIVKHNPTGRVRNCLGVTDYGYIRLVIDNHVEYRKVMLLLDSELEKMWHRRQDVVKYRVASKGSKVAALCKTCRYRNGCPNRRDVAQMRRLA